MSRWSMLMVRFVSDTIWHMDYPQSALAFVWAIKNNCTSAIVHNFPIFLSDIFPLHTAAESTQSALIREPGGQTALIWLNDF